MDQPTGNKKTSIKKLIKSVLPLGLKRGLRKICDYIIYQGEPKRRPPIGRVNFGDLRCLQPIHDNYGIGSGQVIDRYYIDNFLARHAQDIRGRVLEVGDDRYTKQFGKEKVTKSDVLHYVEGNPQATFVGDLSKADHIPSNTFDCIIITQTLQMIYDIRPAIGHLHRILKPNGVVLATSHGTSKIGRFLGTDSWGTYWHFTCQSSRILFEEAFQPGHVDIAAYGNVLSAAAFLYGLVVEDITTEELDHQDPRFEVLIGVRAVK